MFLAAASMVDTSSSTHGSTPAFVPFRSSVVTPSSKPCAHGTPRARHSVRRRKSHRLTGVARSESGSIRSRAHQDAVQRIAQLVAHVAHHALCRLALGLCQVAPPSCGCATLLGAVLQHLRACGAAQAGPKITLRRFVHMRSQRSDDRNHEHAHVYLHDQHTRRRQNSGAAGHASGPRTSP